MPVLVERPKSYETFELKPHEQNDAGKFLNKHQPGDLIYKREDGTVGNYKVTRQLPEGAGILKKLWTRFLNFIDKLSFWLESRLSNKPLEGRVTFLSDKEANDLLGSLAERTSSAAAQTLPPPKDKVVDSSQKDDSSKKLKEKWAKESDLQVETCLEQIRAREAARKKQPVEADGTPQALTPPQGEDEVESSVNLPTPALMTKAEEENRNKKAAARTTFLKQLSPELRLEVSRQQNVNLIPLTDLEELERLGNGFDQAIEGIRQDKISQELQEHQRFLADFEELEKLGVEFDQAMASIRQDKIAQELNEKMGRYFKSMEGVTLDNPALFEGIDEVETDSLLHNSPVQENSTR